jgi:hypothetical protein
MKYKKYRCKNNNLDFYFEIANVEDIVKIRQDIGNGKIKSYREVFKTKTERQALKKAKDMFTDMMKLMADDLIYNNYAIVFQYLNFGYMSVAEVKNEYENYKFDIETQGKQYGLRLFLSPDIGRANKKRYKGKFVRTQKEKLKEQISKGHTY